MGNGNTTWCLCEKCGSMGTEVESISCKGKNGATIFLYNLQYIQFTGSHNNTKQCYFILHIKKIIYGFHFLQTM